MLLLFLKQVVSLLTTIDVSIVFLASRIPKQKSVCLLACSYAWNFGKSKSYCLVPACPWLMKSLC